MNLRLIIGTWAFGTLVPIILIFASLYFTRCTGNNLQYEGCASDVRAHAIYFGILYGLSIFAMAVLQRVFKLSWKPFCLLFLAPHVLFFTLFFWPGLSSGNLISVFYALDIYIVGISLIFQTTLWRTIFSFLPLGQTSLSPS